MKKNRCDKIISKMKNEGINQLIITSSPDIYYATGHLVESGERLQALYLNASGDKKIIINEVCGSIEDNNGVEVYYFNDNSDPIKLLAEMIDSSECIGIDKNWPSHFLIELIELYPKLKFINSASIVDSVRMIKDKEEIDLLRNASRVVDNVMEDLIKYLGSGVSEKQAANELREIFANYKTYEYSFEPIIAYGANGADPHHSTSDTFPKLGDSVVIDIGGRTDFYCSDITRTVFYGQPSAEAKKIYEIVLEANMRAIKIIKPGVLFSDVDRAARDFIEKSGYGEFFTHRTGHCIGIEDHEYPSVSSNNNMVIQEGMAFSVEPGIYIPGKYGVRIEDIIVVTKDGCEVLNKMPKEFKIINS